MLSPLGLLINVCWNSQVGVCGGRCARVLLDCTYSLATKDFSGVFSLDSFWRSSSVSKNTTVRITMATGDIRQDAAERNNKRDIRVHSSVSSCHPFVSCRQIYYRGGLFIYFYLFARDFPDSIWIIYFGFCTQCKSPDDIIISLNNNNTLLLYIFYYYYY